MKSNYEYYILRLADAFYCAYPNPPYSEILNKKRRAYSCLLLLPQPQYYICIPYRTEISHPYAFHFQKSKRSRSHRSGLDHTKLVIIQNLDYLEKKQAVIDHDEYVETINNIDKIVRDAVRFIDEYCGYITGKNCLHKSEYERRYQFSPLKYFHQELGIQNPVRVDAPPNLY